MTVSSVHRIGVVLFPDVEELDAVGPWEVLSVWSRYWPEDGFVVTTLSRTGGPVQCAKGLVVQGGALLRGCAAAGRAGLSRWTGHPAAADR